jgi:hypothetical protein
MAKVLAPDSSQGRVFGRAHGASGGRPRAGGLFRAHRAWPAPAGRITKFQ